MCLESILERSLRVGRLVLRPKAVSSDIKFMWKLRRTMGKIRNKDLERGKRFKRHFKSRWMVYVSEGEERDALFPASRFCAGRFSSLHVSRLCRQKLILTVFTILTYGVDPPRNIFIFLRPKGLISNDRIPGTNKEYLGAGGFWALKTHYIIDCPPPLFMNSACKGAPDYCA